jgi:hypothetical protein
MCCMRKSKNYIVSQMPIDAYHKIEYINRTLFNLINYFTKTIMPSMILKPFFS